MNRLVFITLIIIAWNFSSCKKSKIEAEIPAYIQIDSVIIDLKDGQGSDNQKITDIWINMDGNRLGTFSLPAKFPVIAKEGKHSFKIWAGILKNGINDLRERYVFFEVNEQELNLKPNEVHTMVPTFKYYDENRLDLWIEDFEDPGMKFHTNDSTNLLLQINEVEGSDNTVGYVNMPDTIRFFNFFTEMEMPKNNGAIYMELEYKSNATFAIGVKVKENDGGYRYENPFTYIKPKEDWNKLYINLNEQFHYSSSFATAFDIYFAVSGKDGDENTKLFLDNVKILSFK